MVANGLLLSEWKVKTAEEVLGEKCVNFEIWNFKANYAVMLLCCYAECRHAQWHGAECRNAACYHTEFRYAECIDA